MAEKLAYVKKKSYLCSRIGKNQHMNWENYRLVYRYESYSDGDEMHGRHECDVTELAKLKSDESVPFTPYHCGTPDIDFRRLTPESVELTFHIYVSASDQTTTAIPVTLTPDGEPFYFDDRGKGSWDTEHYLLLDKK